MTRGVFLSCISWACAQTCSSTAVCCVCSCWQGDSLELVGVHIQQRGSIPRARLQNGARGAIKACARYGHPACSQSRQGARCQDGPAFQATQHLPVIVSWSNMLGHAAFVAHEALAVRRPQLMLC